METTQIIGLSVFWFLQALVSGAIHTENNTRQPRHFVEFMFFTLLPVAIVIWALNLCKDEDDDNNKFLFN